MDKFTKEVKEFLKELDKKGVTDKVLRNKLENKIRQLRYEDKELYEQVLYVLTKLTKLHIKELS